MKFTKIITLVLAGMLALSGTAIAGEIEADVIGDAFLGYTSELDPSNLTQAEIDTASADLLDIWKDTEVGSYCEVFAASTWLIINTMQPIKDGEAVSEYDPENAATWNVAYGVVWDQLSSIETRCRNE